MNFENKFHLYNKYAIVQRQVAKELIDIIKIEKKDLKFKKVFEIGCGTGILTELYTNIFPNSKLILNDIFDTRRYLKPNLKYIEFLQGDIKNVLLPKVDLTISSSVLQWISNLNEVVKTISESTEYFAFSIYIEGNLKEIKDHFGVSLKYYTLKEIKDILHKYFSEVRSFEDTILMEFSTPLEALKSLKNSGVTGFKKVDITGIRSYKSKILTYKVGYFWCKK